MVFNKVNKLVVSVHDKNSYVIYIYALKQALNHGLILQKVHAVISFNHAAWLKPYIDMNTELRTNAKNDFEKDYFKLKNNSAFGKTMENIRKHRDIKLVNNDKKRKVLVILIITHILIVKQKIILLNLMKLIIAVLYLKIIILKTLLKILMLL